MNLKNTYKIRSEQSFIQDHMLDDRPILAAAMQLEFAALTLASESTQNSELKPHQFVFHDIRFLRPGLFRGKETMEVGVSINFSEFTISGDDVVLCAGKLELETREATLLPFVSSALDQKLSVDKIYKGWSENGIFYGSQYKTITEIDIGHQSAHATLERLNDGTPWHLNPLLLDGAIQVASCAIGATDVCPPVNIPVYIERLVVHSAFGNITQAKLYVRVHSSKDEVAMRRTDVLIADSNGQILVTMIGLRLMQKESSIHTKNALEPVQPVSVMKWKAIPVEVTMEFVADDSSGKCLIVAPQDQILKLSHVVENIGADSVIGFAVDTLMKYDEVLPDQTALEQQLHDLLIDAPVSNIIYAPFLNRNSQPSPSEACGSVMGLISIIKSLTSSNSSESVRLTVLTEGAQAVVTSDITVFPERTALWGAVRTAFIEYPNWKINIVDLEIGASSSDFKLALQMSKILPNTAAIRNKILYRPIMVSKPLSPSKPLVKPHGRYLITGGSGGIGVELAKHLLEAGAAEVLLLSRSAQHYKDILKIPGIRMIRADLTRRCDLIRALDAAQIETTSIDAVFHAAGILKDSLIRNTTYNDVAAVMAPKIYGALEIQEIFANADLDYIVGFASVSGIFGNIGQAVYASANSFLDGLSMQSESWFSIDWGLWGQVGMGVDLAEKLARTGFKALQTSDAFAAMWRMIAGNCRNAVIANDIINRNNSDIIEESELIETREPIVADKATDNFEKDLLSFIQNHLGLSTLSAKDSLSRYGMSSIISTEIAEMLSNKLGNQVPLTLFLEHDTVRGAAKALQDSLLNYRFQIMDSEISDCKSANMNMVNKAMLTDYSLEVELQPEIQTELQTKMQLSHDVTDRDIAIVALSADLPGAKNLDGFWRLIESGGMAFSTVPNSRFNVDRLLKLKEASDSRKICTIGAFLDQLEPDVATLAKVSKREYEEMDPQQKLVLFHTNEALSQVRSIGHNVGVYIAATYTHHRDRFGLSDVTPYSAMGTMNAFLANRISHSFNLTGPSQTVDTLCSSSLVALQQAVDAIRGGQCSSALVGACNVGLTEWYYRSLSQIGVLSSEYPRPFDAESEGFVPGEGVVTILLKPLKQAESDGDSIWGVIKGIASGHNGGVGSLTVPIREAQTRVIKQAVGDANISILDIDYFETHGTATKLGDPIEISALYDVVDTAGIDAKQWFIGATKGNVGHQEPVAGLASLVKVLLCFKNKIIPPIAGLKQLNPALKQYQDHLLFPTSAINWTCIDRVRRAGISAFGMGGTNAHVIVEEYSTDLQPSGTEHTIDTKSIIEAHQIYGRPIVPAAFTLQHLFQSATMLTDIKFLKAGTETTPLICQRVQESLHVMQGSDLLATAVPQVVNSSMHHAISLQQADHVIENLDAKELYEWFENLDMYYDKPLRVIKNISFTGLWATADLDTTATTIALIDAIFQICGVLTKTNPTSSSGPLIPKAIKRACTVSGEGKPTRVEIWRDYGLQDQQFIFSGCLLDSKGMPVYEFESIEFTALPYIPDGVEKKSIYNSKDRPNLNQSDVKNENVSDQSADTLILETIRNILHDPSIQANTNLEMAGMDSILAGEIAHRLGQLGWEVNPITVLTAHNVIKLNRDIGLRLNEQTSHLSHIHQTESTDDSTSKNSDNTQKAVGISGIAYRLPHKKGDAGFWQTLLKKNIAFTHLPNNRYSVKSQNRNQFVGAFLDSIGDVDANLFEFTPHMADAMDPQMRLLLEATWEALEDAGIDPLCTQKNLGVFVGASYNHYKDAFFSPALDSYSGLGNQNAFLANRLSYFFDCTGPSVTIDTLCSSSLVALHQAAQSLKNHECNQAIVAGVNIPVTNDHCTTMANLSTLSSNGELSAFDSKADGFLPGEGVVVLVLRRLDEVDGQVKAIIKGTAVNHGGRSAGLTVPSSDAQAVVISAALRDAGVDEDSIGLIEAHGTGTVLGDPIEIEGLKKAWKKSKNHRQVCGLGSVKSNIGHLEPASGLAGVVKVILAMKEGILPPTAGISRPNDHIVFEDSPFFLVDRPTPWSTERPLAGVSSFGMGGVNAHVILAPTPKGHPVERIGKAPEEFICKVSAATESAVRKLASLYAKALEGLSDFEAADFCYTANTARATLSYIVVISVTRVDELVKELAAIANEKRSIILVKDEEDLLPADRGADYVVERTVEGIKFPSTVWKQISWSNARIVSIPIYPFERSYHWINKGSILQTISWKKEALVKNVSWSVTDKVFDLMNVASRIRDVWLSPRVATYWKDEDLTSILSHNNLQRVALPEQAEIIIEQYAANDELEELWNRMTNLPRVINPLAKIVLICQELYPRKDDASYDPIKTIIAASAAAAWRSIAAENSVAALVVDNTDAANPEQTIRRIMNELEADKIPAVVSWIQGVRHVMTYETKQDSKDTEFMLATDSSDYWVVIGGGGGIGLILSQFLNECGYRVIAIGRSQKPSDKLQEFILSQGMDRVVYRSADATNLQELSEQCKPINGQGILTGIINAAGGTSQVSSAVMKTWEQVNKQIATKITTSLNVIKIAESLGGKYVVLTSSLAAVEMEAGKGLADYAAANAAQAMIANLHSVHDRLIVIAHLWPNWLDVGLNADSEYSQAHSLSTKEAVSYFAKSLTESGVQVIHGHPSEEEEIRAIPENKEKLVALKNNNRKNNDWLTQCNLIEDAIYAVLGPVDNTRLFSTMGLNSLLIADLVATIELKTGLVVAPSIFFEQQNVEQLINALTGEFSDSAKKGVEVSHIESNPVNKGAELATALAQRKEIINERI